MNVFQTSAPRRAGVSLLEVLISIGVTSVGLLGVLALIPLAGATARQGQVFDRAAVIGPAALSEVRARDMLNPSQWVHNNNVVIVPPKPAIPPSYCIDPLGVAVTGSLNFPHAATAQMPRLTLNNGLGAPMSAPLANAIFRSQDDLALVVSERDRSLPPSQMWNRQGAGAQIRRQTEGTMTWMLTAFPNLAKGSPHDFWTVSVVVINRRVLATGVQNEFTAMVTGMPGGGVTGGEFVLQFASLDEAREAKTPENSWLLLGGQSGTISVFQWYRVLASDSTTPLERYVTLAGPDWPMGLNNVQATIIPGTVAVYQENMRLEIGKATSLWRY